MRHISTKRGDEENAQGKSSAGEHSKWLPLAVALVSFSSPARVFRAIHP